jgi:hypothetical protein
MEDSTWCCPYPRQKVHSADGLLPIMSRYDKGVGGRVFAVG